MKSTGPSSQRKQRLIGSIIVLASAVLGLWKFHDPLERDLALGVSLVGLRFMRMSRSNAFDGSRSPGVGGSAGSRQTARNKISRWVWVLAFVSLPVAGASIVLMYVDQFGYGGRYVWPLYLFAASFPTTLLVWLYIAGKKWWWFPF